MEYRYSLYLYFTKAVFLFFLYNNTYGQEVITPDYKLGIESISSALWKKLSDGSRIGLVTNQTGKDSSGRRTIDIFLKQGVTVTCILVPEHGLDGKIKAEKDVPDQIDTATGVPVVSLYKKWSGAPITPETAENIDIFVVDLQDVGMRHYTYISTLYRMLEAAVTYKKKIIVLDRPNFLGGLMEGPLVAKELHSFISIAPIPLRHGMTIGELAHFFNKKVLKEPAQLHVVAMKGYERQVNNQELIAALSPNISSRESLLGYSFLGLLGEVRPFNVGVGTKHSFKKIGLERSLKVSKKAWKELRMILQDYGISSTFEKYTGSNGKEYEGLLLYLKTVEKISTLSLFFSIIFWAHKWNIPLQFAPIFDKAMGISEIKNLLIEKKSLDSMHYKINKQLSSFYNKARSSFLYKPHPQTIVSLINSQKN